MIDAKRLVELMTPDVLGKLAEYMEKWSARLKPREAESGMHDHMLRSEEDALDSAAAVLREVATSKDSMPFVRDVLPGSDDAVLDSRDELHDALALGIATLLRRANEDRTADLICNFADMFRHARRQHAQGLAEVASEMDAKHGEQP